jgi:hypothetical protein
VQFHHAHKPRTQAGRAALCEARCARVMILPKHPRILADSCDLDRMTDEPSFETGAAGLRMELERDGVWSEGESLIGTSRRRRQPLGAGGKVEHVAVLVEHVVIREHGQARRAACFRQRQRSETDFLR